MRGSPAELETAFNLQLKSLSVELEQSPLEMLLREFKHEELSIKEDSWHSEASKIFLVLSEIEELGKSKSDEKQIVRSLILLCKNQEDRRTLTKLAAKWKKLENFKKDRLDLSLPKKPFLMQKLGKIFKKSMIRDSFMTKDKFGQLKSKKNTELIKTVAFENQQVAIQTRKDKKNKEGKADKTGKEDSPLVWVDSKELKDANYRVCFTDMTTGRLRALYFNDRVQAQLIHNNSIAQRILAGRAKGVKAMLGACRGQWAVRQAEYFYLIRLRGFLTGGGIEAAIRWREEAEARLRMFLKAEFPNIDWGARGDASKRKGEISLSPAEMAGAALTDFATRVGGDAYTRSDLSQLDAMRRRGERIDSTRLVRFDVAGFLRAVQNFVAEPREPRGDWWPRLTERVWSDCWMFVRIEKLVVENHFADPETGWTRLDLEEFCAMEVSAYVDRGYEASHTHAFLTQTSPEFLAFDLAAEVEVTLQNMGHLILRLGLVGQDRVIFEERIDLRSRVDYLRLESRMTVPIGFDYKGHRFNGALGVRLGLMPRSIEIAHLLMNRKMLEENYKRLGSETKSPGGIAAIRSGLRPRKPDSETSTTPSTSGAQTPKSPQSSEPPHNFLFFEGESASNDYLSYEDLTLWVRSGTASLLDSFRPKLISAVRANSSEPAIFSGFVDALPVPGDKLRRKDPVSQYFSHFFALGSPTERFLIHRALFDHFFASIYGTDLTPKAWLARAGFHRPVVVEINKRLERFFEAQPGIAEMERSAIRRVVFTTYLLIENSVSNSANKPPSTTPGSEPSGPRLPPTAPNTSTSQPVRFHPSWVPWVAKLTLINHDTLPLSQLLTIIATQLLLSLPLPGSVASPPLFNDNLLLYFKLLRRKLAYENTQHLQRTNPFIDNIFIEALTNSFADYLSPVDLSLYQDLKCSLLLLLLTPQPLNPCLATLDLLGLSLPPLIDAVLLLAALAALDPADFQTPRFAAARLRRAVVRRVRRPQKLFEEMLESIELIRSNGFFEAEFKEIRRELQDKRLRKAEAFQGVAVAFKVAGVGPKEVKKILAAEIGEDPTFRARVKAVLPLRAEFGGSVEEEPSDDEEEEDPKKSAKNDASLSKSPTDKASAPSKPLLADAGGDHQLSPPQADIFFEVAEGFDRELPYLKIDKSQEFLLYANGLEPRLLRSVVSFSSIKSDLLNISQLDISDLREFVRARLRGSDKIAAEIFENLAELFGGSEFSKLKVLVLLCVFCSEDQNEVADALGSLALEITKIIFPRTQSHLTEVLKPICETLYSLLPSCSSRTPLSTFIDLHSPKGATFLSSACLRFPGGLELEVSPLLSKFFNTSIEISGSITLSFENELCVDLQAILAELILKTPKLAEIDRFSLYLELTHRTRSHRYSVPFKVLHEPLLQVFAGRTEPVGFPFFVNENDLVEPPVLRGVFLDSPLANWSQVSAVRMPTFFAWETLALKITSKKVEALMECEVLFAGEDDKFPLSCVPTPFLFTEDVDGPKPLPKLKIDVDFANILLPVHQLIRYILAKIVERVDKNELVTMIKANSNNWELLSKKSKHIDPMSYVFEYEEYENSIGEKKPMRLILNFN